MLKNQLRKYLQEQGTWTPKGQILAQRWQNQKDFTYYLPSTTDRKLRELESESVIAVKDDNKSVVYKWIPHDMRPRYIPKSDRKDEKLFTNH